MLSIRAGSSFVASYTENGHVTKDRLAPDNLPHPGNYTWFIAQNSAVVPSPLSTLGDLFTKATTLATGNYDDGKCAEDNTKGRAGPRACQSTVTVPQVAAGTYQLVWLWNFPKVTGVVEMYSSCMDITVLPGSSLNTFNQVVNIANPGTSTATIYTTLNKMTTVKPQTVSGSNNSPNTVRVTETVFKTVYRANAAATDASTPDGSLANI